MHTPDDEPAPKPQETGSGLPAPGPNQPPIENFPAVLVSGEPPHDPDLRPIDIALLDIPAAMPRIRDSLPPDVRTSLTGLDLFILLIFYFVAGTVLTLLVATASAIAFGAAAKSTVVIVAQALLFGAMLALLYGMIRSRGTADFWPSVGWRGLPGHSKHSSAVMLCVLGGSALAFVVAIAGSYLDRNLVLPMEELFRDRQSVLLMAGLGVLVAPLVEETIFRGCIYPVLARRWGVGASVLATGILFGTAHAAQLWPGFGQITLMMCVGIVLTYVRARTGTVAASYFVHLGYNSFIFATLFVSTGGLRHFPS